MAIDSISGRISGTTASSKLTTKPSIKESSAENNAVESVEILSSERLKTALADNAQAPVNAERVASLKQAVADGTYQVNAERVAAKIVHSENTLYGSGP
jgi:negative regulator of flagellin synthesis FlgM